VLSAERTLIGPQLKLANRDRRIEFEDKVPAMTVTRQALHPFIALVERVPSALVLASRNGGLKSAFCFSDKTDARRTFALLNLTGCGKRFF
jgi:hypothetical protein